MNFDGMKVIIYKPISSKVKRSIKERLFTRPFTPFVNFKTVWHEVIEDGKCVYDNGRVIMNQRTYNKYLKAKGDQ